MNAPVHLLHRVVGATAHLQSDIEEGHPSSGILGAERMGTGVVVGSGSILTAHYVLIGARSVLVAWPDGTSSGGRVAAIDYETGLGVVEPEGSAPRGLSLAAPGDARPGLECFVVASVGDGRQVATGTITSVAPFDAFWEYRVERGILASVQSPGLGGGPLVDSRGSVIGIAALSLAEIGRFTFAIPADLATPLLEGIRSRGRWSAPRPRAWIGLTCYPLDDRLVVAGVIPDSPAANAGLLPGDLLVAVDGAPIRERAELFDRIWRHASGEDVALDVLREDRPMRIAVRSGNIEDFFAVGP